PRRRRGGCHGCRKRRRPSRDRPPRVGGEGGGAESWQSCSRRRYSGQPMLRRRGSPSKPRWALSWAAALAVAGATALAMRPRRGLLEPRPVSADSHFSAEEIGRARRFARPQLAIGLVAMALEGIALATLLRRPLRVPAGLAGRPLAAGAATGAALSVALTATGLPLA